VGGDSEAMPKDDRHVRTAQPKTTDRQDRFTLLPVLMNTPAYLALPHDAAHKSARALLMALGLIPEVVKNDLQAISLLAVQMEMHPDAVALIDLGSLPTAFKHVIDLAQQLPAAIRRRVILFRHEQGSVWPSDLAWIEYLGFAGLFAEVDATSMLTDSQQLPAMVAQLTGRAPLQEQKLAQYFAAMLTKPDPLTLRGLIRAQTNRNAETLAQIMASGVRVADRSYRLSKYPACFLGSEAVRWLCSQFKCSTDSAVQTGQALLHLGLMHHVVHEHAFENADFFYRLDATASTTETHLGRLLEELKSSKGLNVSDRIYLGKVYPACWVGQDAISWLSKAHRLQRHEAENLLNRLLSFGLIEHVTQEHRVKDANLFFRFG
jgi:Domain found in Dishevelled, Egl-10, and Pleckstrin (DEP)